VFPGRFEPSSLLQKGTPHFNVLPNALERGTENQRLQRSDRKTNTYIFTPVCIGSITLALIFHCSQFARNFTQQSCCCEANSRLAIHENLRFYGNKILIKCSRHGPPLHTFASGTSLILSFHLRLDVSSVSSVSRPTSQLHPRLAYKRNNLTSQNNFKCDNSSKFCGI
jgi:hypothetical protein